jgi:hypothetical protein
MNSQKLVKTRLGDLLLKKKLITENQLQEAINAQKTSHLQLGAILIALNYVTQKQINHALKVQHKLRNAVLSSILSVSPFIFMSAVDAAPKTSSSFEKKEPNGGGYKRVKGGKDVIVVEEPVAEDPVIEPLPEDPITEEPVIEPLPEDPIAEEPVIEPLPEAPVAEPLPEEPVEPVIDVGGTVRLTWDYPQYREDGSDLEIHEIQSFRVYMVSEEGDVGMMHEVDGLDTSYDYGNVAQGAHYFVITTVDIDGIESDFSEMINVSIL